MTLTQMKYAIAVADTGSMNEAARSLFIAQPVGIHPGTGAGDWDRAV